jgi:hypothetical protein
MILWGVPEFPSEPSALGLNLTPQARGFLVEVYLVQILDRNSSIPLRSVGLGYVAKLRCVTLP